MLFCLQHFFIEKCSTEKVFLIFTFKNFHAFVDNLTDFIENLPIIDIFS